MINDMMGFRPLISLIMKIINNYNRTKDFFYIIIQNFDYLQIDIKQIFFNNEIFDLFKSNKRILLIFC